MTEINEFLTTIYPKETWKDLKEIILFDPDLEGEITLKQKDFPKLERIMYTPQIRIINDWVINLSIILKRPRPQGLKINHYHNVELLKYDFLETFKEVAKKIEKKIPKPLTVKKLNLSKHGIRGNLVKDLNVLQHFSDLEELEIELSCPYYEWHYTANYITSLELSKNKKLKKITFTNSPVKLNLDIFEGLENLEELKIAGSDWVGSFESLKDLPLKKLDISYNNSKLTGWKHLPSTITNLECKGTDLYQEFKPFAFDVGAWKFAKYPDLITEEKKELIKQLNSKLEKSYLTIKELNKVGLTDDNLRSQIEILEVQSKKLMSITLE